MIYLNTVRHLVANICIKVMYLFFCHVDVNEQDDDYVGQTALTWAAKNGHENIVKILLENSAINVTAENYLGVILKLSRVKLNFIMQRMKSVYVIIECPLSLEHYLSVHVKL